MEDFVKRIVIEKYELEQKIKKLKQFLDSDKFKEIDTDDTILLVNQLGAMETYSLMLSKRLDRLDNKKPNKPHLGGIGQFCGGSTVCLKGSPWTTDNDVDGKIKYTDRNLSILEKIKIIEMLGKTLETNSKNDKTNKKEKSKSKKDNGWTEKTY